MSTAKVRLTRIAWFGSPPPFHEGTREGSNQRRVASQSDPCIEQGLGGCTRVLTQRMVMPLHWARARGYSLLIPWGNHISLMSCLGKENYLSVTTYGPLNHGKWAMWKGRPCPIHLPHSHTCKWHWSFSTSTLRGLQTLRSGYTT
jgi:hypothetical protein